MPVPLTATIFSFIYHQGTNSLSILDSVFGVSLYAPNVAEPMMARVAKIAIVRLCIVQNYLDLMYQYDTLLYKSHRNSVMNQR